MRDADLLVFGNQVRYWRRIFGWTQAEMARRAGVCPGTIVTIERTNQCGPRACALVADAIAKEKNRAERITAEAARVASAMKLIVDAMAAERAAGGSQ